MNWSDYFVYVDGALIWKVPVGRKTRARDPAGTLTPRGYISVTLGGKKYRAHRIIWEMLRGPIPLGLEIDHSDGVRSNNKINNLSLVTRTNNSKNRARRSDNTSGATGVTYCKVNKKWKAYVKQQGKLTHLGLFTHLEDAVIARQKQNELLGFSNRHGA